MFFMVMTNVVCDVHSACISHSVSTHYPSAHLPHIHVCKARPTFRLDSFLDSQNRKGNMTIGCNDRVQWVIVLAQSSHVDKRIRAVRINEYTHQKMENCGNSGWRRCLQLCVDCSDVLLLQLPHTLVWTTQRPGGISLNEQGCRFLKLNVIQLVFHIYGRQTNFLHYFNMKYSEYMGNNKDSYA